MANRSSADVRARTAEEFVAELRRLRAQSGQPSFRELSRIAERRRGGPDGLRVEPLPPSTTSEILAGKRLPRLPRLEFVESYVAACLIAGTPGELGERVVAAELTRWRELWCALAEPSSALVDNQAASPAVEHAGNDTVTDGAVPDSVATGSANGVTRNALAINGMAPSALALNGAAANGSVKPPVRRALDGSLPRAARSRRPAVVWVMVAVAFVAGVAAGGAGVRWWDSGRPPAATGPLGPDRDTCSTTDVQAPEGKDVLRLPASASAASWWTNAGGVVDLATDGKAFDATIVGRPGQPSDALIVKGGVDIVRGRSYALAFTARADRSASVRVRVQNNAPDYTESYTRDLSVAPGGCRHLYQFTGARSSDHSELTFQVGGQPADLRLRVSDVMLVEQAG